MTGSTGNSQNDDVMSDLARRLQERRAKTDQVLSVSSKVLPTTCSKLSVKVVV